MTNDDFRETLRIDFKGISVTQKRQLGVLMRLSGYRRSREAGAVVKRKPSQLQLDVAWNYLKHKQVDYAIVPTGFKKVQIRNAKTGRIMGWRNKNFLERRG